MLAASLDHLSDNQKTLFAVLCVVLVFLVIATFSKPTGRR